MRKPTTIDFETFPIEARPSYPPRPVGVSIKEYGKPAFYLAWGHPSENNCTFEEAKKTLTKYCLNADSLLFHNAKFDIDVLETFFDITLEWSEIEDTLILGYLYNPHEDRLGLKPLAQRLLGLAPDERDVVVDWLCDNEPQGALDWLYRTKGMRHLSDKPKSEAYAGAYVAYAPGDIVGSYANGDTERTEALWDFLQGNISERGMDEAYDRERKLLPILLDMERNGIPVDLVKLESDVARYTEVMNKLNVWIIKRLRCSSDINLDSGAKLVEALIAAKVVDLKKLGVTPKSGKPKTDKASLDAAVSDRQLSAVLRYRSQLKTCLSTFMENWLATAKRSNGYIYTYFHQVRGTDSNGTKTGRLSSTPNFQNLANEFQPLFVHEVEEDKGLPVAPFELPSLPLIRGYIIPPKGYSLTDRDFCFSPDTEILTINGFVRFDELQHGVECAQWNDNIITYAKPLAYQKVFFEGELHNIIGKKKL